MSTYKPLVSNKTYLIAIVLAIGLSALGYIVSPPDKQKQLEETAIKLHDSTQKVVKAICADDMNVLREYVLNVAQEENPDLAGKDPCEIVRRLHPPQTAGNFP